MLENTPPHAQYHLHTRSTHSCTPSLTPISSSLSESLLDCSLISLMCAVGEGCDRAGLDLPLSATTSGRQPWPELSSHFRVRLSGAPLGFLPPIFSAGPGPQPPCERPRIWECPLGPCTASSQRAEVAPQKLPERPWGKLPHPVFTLVALHTLPHLPDTPAPPPQQSPLSLKPLAGKQLPGLPSALQLLPHGSHIQVWACQLRRDSSILAPSEASCPRPAGLRAHSRLHLSRCLQRSLCLISSLPSSLCVGPAPARTSFRTDNQHGNR